MKAFSYLILSAGTLLAIAVLIAGLSLVHTAQGTEGSLPGRTTHAAMVLDLRN